MPPTHLDTRRAYCRVVRGEFRRPGNKYSPGLRLATQNSRRAPAVSARSAQSERVCRSFSVGHLLCRWHSRGRHVIDAQRDEVAAAQFTVNGEIEHCQVARALLQVQPGTYRPDVTGPQGRLWASHLSLVPGRGQRNWFRSWSVSFVERSPSMRFRQQSLPQNLSANRSYRS